MIAKMLGFIDVVAGIVLILAQYGLVPFKFAFMFAMYLILKLIVFRDGLSFVDGIVGVYLLLVFTIHWEVVSFIMAIYLILKGMASMF